MRMLRAFWDAAVSIDAKAEALDEKHMPLCRAGELSELWRQSGLDSVHEQPLTGRRLRPDPYGRDFGGRGACCLGACGLHFGGHGACGRAAGGLRPRRTLSR